MEAYNWLVSICLNFRSDSDKMGNNLVGKGGSGWYERMYAEWKDPEFNPNMDEPGTFPSNYGFEAQRVERKMMVSEEECIKAMVPLKYRDYCAQYYMNYMRCKRDSSYLKNYWSCGDEKHDWQHCQHEDFILRMKEYERERRLLQREKKEVERMERRKSKE